MTKFGAKKVKVKKIGIRLKRKRRIRGKVSGSADCPRLSIFRSSHHTSAQLIDDLKGSTLLSVSTMEKEFKGKSGKTRAAAELVGETIAKRALEKGIKSCVFDRNGFVYHGRVQAFAEKAREAGLQF